MRITLGCMKKTHSLEKIPIFEGVVYLNSENNFENLNTPAIRKKVLNGTTANTVIALDFKHLILSLEM